MLNTAVTLLTLTTFLGTAFGLKSAISPHNIIVLNSSVNMHLQQCVALIQPLHDTQVFS